MEADNNFFNLVILRVRGVGNEFVYALVVVFDKTRNLFEILRKYICQASPAMKYNDNHIEYAKSKGGRSVKACLQHPISVFFASCKNDDHVKLEVIIDPSLFQKPPPKDAFSAMINASTTKRTILTSNFAVCKVEKFQTAYETAANKEYFIYLILFILFDSKVRSTMCCYSCHMHRCIYSHGETLFQGGTSIDQINDLNRWVEGGYVCGNKVRDAPFYARRKLICGDYIEPQ